MKLSIVFWRKIRSFTIDLYFRFRNIRIDGRGGRLGFQAAVLWGVIGWINLKKKKIKLSIVFWRKTRSSAIDSYFRFRKLRIDGRGCRLGMQAAVLWGVIGWNNLKKINEIRLLWKCTSCVLTENLFPYPISKLIWETEMRSMAGEADWAWRLQNINAINECFDGKSNPL